MSLFVKILGKTRLYATLLFVVANAFVVAQQDSWGRHGSDPIDILDTVAGEVNEEYKIQDTELNDTSNLQGSYNAEYKISNTLDSLRQQLSPYLQWAIYIGLSLAVILLIYNGFLLVTGSLHGAGEISAVQKRLLNVVMGVGILTGFYFIVKLAIIVINAISQ